MKTRTIFMSLFLTTFCILNLKAQDVKNELSDDQLIKLFAGLRVADVCDGMDMAGLMNVGLVDQSIAPLWKDSENFSHQFVGIALTVKYIPSQRMQVPDEPGLDSYKNWRDQWYTHISGEPFIEEIQPGHVIVIDNKGDGDTDCGTIGSNNSMLWTTQGAVGIVTAGGMRDIDEVIKQKIPVYTDYDNRGRGIRPGRNELESYNEPITIGNTLINPGDVIIADSDGVIVVPREMAMKVADGAREELNLDKAARRKLYDELGIPLDFTVE
jgi:regulator of RNase E activity RraA